MTPTVSKARIGEGYAIDLYIPNPEESFTTVDLMSGQRCSTLDKRIMFAEQCLVIMNNVDQFRRQRSRYNRPTSSSGGSGN